MSPSRATSGRPVVAHRCAPRSEVSGRSVRDTNAGDRGRRLAACSVTVDALGMDLDDHALFAGAKGKILVRA